MLKSVGIIGSGKVAKHLADLFANYSGLELRFIAARNVEKGLAIAKSSRTSFIQLNDLDCPQVDWIVVAVSDDALQAISPKLSVNTIITHTSGSVSMDIFSEYQNHGVFYALQTFTENTCPQWENIPLLIESNQPKQEEALLNVAKNISKRAMIFSSNQRKQLHLAAVISCNFSNYLWTVANTICDEHAIPFDLLLPLIEKTANNLKESPARLNQTGPAVRKDDKIIEEHSHLLEQKKDIQSLYLKLTQLIQEEHKL